MLFYRYLDWEAGFLTLRDKSLKASKISDFNDPFEGVVSGTLSLNREEAEAEFIAEMTRPENLKELQEKRGEWISKKDLIDDIKLVAQSHPERLQDTLLKISVEISKSMYREVGDTAYRITCLSASTATQKSELLLWSHYGKSHFGIRIGFDFPLRLKSILFPVEYEDQFLKIDARRIHDPSYANTLVRGMLVKNKAWEYEQEHRLIFPINSCHQNLAGMDFYPLQKDWIRSVDFGLRCKTEDRNKILELIRQDYPHARVRQAIHHETDYSLDYEEIPSH